MQLKDELFLVARTLEDAGIGYAVCGGLAVIIHGYPRSTRDIDLLIQAEDLERARKALERAGYAIASGWLPLDAGEPTEMRVFRLAKVEGGDCMTLDLVLVTPFLEDVWRNRENYLVEGRPLCVVSREGLIKMKRLGGRPQDLADLSELGRADSPEGKSP